MIQAEIKHLYEEIAFPEMNTLSILISKVKKNDYIIEIINFINDYFDQYNHYWSKNSTSRKNHIFEKWKLIFDRFADEERKNICIKILNGYAEPTI